MNNSQSFWDVLISWFPMLLLVGVWIFFLVRARSGAFVNQYQKDCMEFTRRQAEALERIAAALEKNHGA